MKTQQQNYQEIPLGKLAPCPFNPRKHFDGQKFDELVESVRLKGVLEPVLVRNIAKDKFEIVAGERRYRALTEVAKSNGGIKKAVMPCIVRELTDDEAFDLMTIENLHREDLTPREEAEGFKTYLDKKGPEHLAELAERTGLSPGYIHRRVKVLSLPEKVLKAWDKGEITYGHCEQLCRLDSPEAVEKIFDDIKDDLEFGYCTVSDLKQIITNESLSLKDAMFDTKAAGCNTCGSNSDVQKQLFDDLGKDSKKKCTNQACYRQHTLEYMQQHWDEERERLGAKTNGFRMFEAYGKGYLDLSGKIRPACKKCEYFVSMLSPDGRTFWAQACVGDAACYKKTTAAPAKENTDGNGETEEGAEDPQPRVAWHGEHFREQFYKDALPAAINNTAQIDLRILGLTLYCLLREYTFLADWWGAKNKSYYDLGDSEAVPSGFHHYFDVERLFRPIADCTEVQPMLDNIKEAVKQLIMTVEFTARDRRLIADYFGIDLQKEWRITDEYLQKKTTKEILQLGDKLGVFEEKAAKDFLYETLGQKRGKFDKCKKGELIRIFLESGVDLAGRVPDEILKQ